MERRNFVRYSLRLPTVFKWVDLLGEQQLGAGFTRDISPEGAFIFSSDAPAEGAEFSMEILLPSLDELSVPGLRLQAKGRVIRVELENQDPGFAVSGRFSSPSDQNAAMGEG